MRNKELWLVKAEGKRERARITKGEARVIGRRSKHKRVALM